MKILLSDFIHNCLAMSLFLLRRVEDSFIVAGVAAWPGGVAQELSRLRDGSIVWELQGCVAIGVEPEMQAQCGAIDVVQSLETGFSGFQEALKARCVTRQCVREGARQGGTF